MKNERATAQFQWDSCISHNELRAVRLMNIHRAQIETRRCILAQVPPERLRPNRVVLELQLDDSDDLPNLQRSARIAGDRSAGKGSIAVQGIRHARRRA